MGKILERVLLDRLLAEVEDSIPKEQFGFRPKHSTTNQLHRLTDFITHGFNIRHSTCALFVDVRKAFDKVWHKGLILKLITLKVSPPLIHIIHSFLRERTFFVRLPDATSAPKQIRAGVPQGSVLAPSLYTIFVHDFPTAPNVHVGLYADDTMIFARSRSPHFARTYLQRSLEVVEEWFNKWRIQINPSKCATILFHKSSRPPTLDPIEFFDEEVPWSATTKYLGVTLDSKLTWKPHIEDLRCRASGAITALYPLINRKSPLDLRLKSTLYKLAIRSRLSYAAPVWFNAAPTHIKRLEAVQNKTLRMITNAPFYVRNTIIQRDLDIPPLLEYLRLIAQKYFDEAPSHPNPLIASIDTTAGRGRHLRPHQLRHLHLQPPPPHSRGRPPEG